MCLPERVYLFTHWHCVAVTPCITVAQYNFLRFAPQFLSRVGLCEYAKLLPAFLSQLTYYSMARIVSARVRVCVVASFDGSCLYVGHPETNDLDLGVYAIEGGMITCFIHFIDMHLASSSVSSASFVSASSSLSPPTANDACPHPHSRAVSSSVVRAIPAVAHVGINMFGAPVHVAALWNFAIHGKSLIRDGESQLPLFGFLCPQKVKRTAGIEDSGEGNGDEGDEI